MAKPGKKKRKADDEEVLSDGSSSDWETDEEQLVHVELSGVFQDDLTSKEDRTKFVGLDTDKPVVQIGGQVFEGRYADAVGTSVFFKTSERDQDGVDQVFDRLPTKKVEYFCKTDKKLTLKRVFLKRKA